MIVSSFASCCFRSFFCLWLFAQCLFIEITPAYADNWKAVLRDVPMSPSTIIAVDKGRQLLQYFENKKPLSASENYVCTTGQKAGGKTFQGDLKTPEGIYFIVGKVQGRLDFMEYGDIAYALNYPNPIDKLKGRTGYGIWIHSRGRDITPMETRGCIAVNLGDMDKLASQLVSGLPVILADSMISDAGSKNSPDIATLALLKDKTVQWNQAWSARSKDFFDFYDAEAYTKAQNEVFSGFRTQKERLFAMLPWIHIVHDDIQVLQGPDYWVTWFKQYYRAPNLTSEGVRRLYWHKEGDTYRIVGMEWLPGNYNMEAAYLDTIQPTVTQFIEAWRKTWEAGNINGYMKFYADAATQAPRSGKNAIEQHKRVTWSAKKPKKIVLSNITVRASTGGVNVSMMQEYSDTSGYKDKGMKNVLLYPHGDTWAIASETWTAVK